MGGSQLGNGGEGRTQPSRCSPVPAAEGWDRDVGAIRPWLRGRPKLGGRWAVAAAARAEPQSPEGDGAGGGAVAAVADKLLLSC